MKSIRIVASWLGALLGALLALSAAAQHRSVGEAQAVAWRFLQRDEGRSVRAALAVAQAEQLHVARAADSTQAAHVLVAYAKRGTGAFVVVAADAQLPTILGYGEGLAVGDSLPEGLRALLASYDHAWRMAQVRQAVAQPQPSAPHTATYAPIAPFLGIVRHQSAPFNGACPRYIHAAGDTSAARTLVGCVATAMEQVLSYYGRAITLRDSLPARTTPHYYVPSLPAGTQLRFDRTLADYRSGYAPEDSAAVAQVSLALGLAAKMHWGLHESGTNLTAPIAPLREAFGLGYAHYLDSYRYAPHVWWQLLYNELSHGRPVVYAGSLMTMGAHAFVIDGVDAAGRVHVHWGFGGKCNGYFRLSLLNPFSEEGATASDALFGLFANHQAIVLHPEPQAPLPDTLARTGREIVVDSLVLHRPATNQGYTPATLYVRNVAAATLTTPLLVFTNAPTDTAALAQARAAALTSCTLAPSEARALPLYLKLTASGVQQLRVTPEENIIYDQTIGIAEATPARLTYALRLLHTTDSTLTAVATYDNTTGATPAGIRVTYALFEGDSREADTDKRHFVYLDVPAGGVLTDTIRFAHLTPSTPYYLALREPWHIHASLTATTQAAPTTHVRTATHAAEAPRYDLLGRPRPLDRPYRWRKGAVAMPRAW